MSILTPARKGFTNVDDPAYWAHRAANIRELASASRDENVKQQLAKIAAIYDELEKASRAREKAEIMNRELETTFVRGSLPINGRGGARPGRADAQRGVSTNVGRGRRNV